MNSGNGFSMNRRQLLKIGSSLTALGGLGLAGRYFLLPPRRSRTLASQDELAKRLIDTMSPELVDRACVPYDHPARQYHNRGVGGCGVDIDVATFDRGQRRLLTDLFHAGLSQAGRERVPNQFFVNWPGVHLMRLLVCGDPRTPPYQILLTGPHLNLRIGGTSAEGVAFGGPQVYGDQRGNRRPGLPGNLYRYQFETGRELFRSLATGQREAALRPHSPIETQVELRGSRASFEGLPVAELAPSSRERVREWVQGVLVNYPEADASYAHECLIANGGLDSLHLSYYEDSSLAGGQYQNFRLEGPAAVFYFKGHPHVHAYVNVAMDGDRPLSIGEELGHNPAPLEGSAVKDLFERAMRTQTGADLAYYEEDSVVGRLRSGTIRAGDIYTLEIWQDRVVVAHVKGANLKAPFVEQLRERKLEHRADREYTIATTSEVLDSESAQRLGAVSSREARGLVREATIAHLRTFGFQSHEKHSPSKF